MVKKYQKKPVVVEAVLYTGHNNMECETFIGSSNYDNTLNYPNIKTLEGTMHVSVGDFIIKGTQGEFYPCKPDSFLAAYKEVYVGRDINWEELCEGDECPECGLGVMICSDVINCSCHINPPCSACTDAGYECDECGIKTSDNI